MKGTAASTSRLPGACEPSLFLGWPASAGVRLTGSHSPGLPTGPASPSVPGRQGLRLAPETLLAGLTGLLASNLASAWSEPSGPTLRNDGRLEGWHAGGVFVPGLAIFAQPRQSRTVAFTSTETSTGPDQPKCISRFQNTSWPHTNTHLWLGKGVESWCSGCYPAGFPTLKAFPPHFIVSGSSCFLQNISEPASICLLLSCLR